MTTPADKAFVNSDTHAIVAGGADPGRIEFQPYTPERIVAAQAMGLRHPYIGPEAMETFGKTGIYPGALQDVLIVLWLCTLDDTPSSRAKSRDPVDKTESDPWTPARALRSPDAALTAAIAWGAEHGIVNTKSKEWWAAYGQFIDMVSEISASRGVPQVTDEPDDDDPNA